MADRVFPHAFDYLLYPFVMWKFGILNGGLVMTVVSCLLCYGSIRLYDWTKTDWLAIETIKATVNGMREFHGHSGPREFIASMLKKTDTIVFFFLSMKFDAATPYFTCGKERINSTVSRNATGKFFFPVWPSVICTGGFPHTF